LYKYKFESVEEYKSYFKELIEKERNAEKEFHLNEIKRLSGIERQKRGRAVLGLRMRYIGEFLDFKIYRFNRNNMPEHQIKVGDIVLISKGEPLKFNQEATISSVGKNFIEVYSKDPIFRSKLYRIDLFVNDITFKRMINALEQMDSGQWTGPAWGRPIPDSNPGPTGATWTIGTRDLFRVPGDHKAA